MTDVLNAEELANIEKSAVYSLNDKTIFQLLDHIAALESELATSEAARERAEELLHDCWEQFAVEDKYGKCAGGLSVLEDLLDHFAHTEEGKG